MNPTMTTGGAVIGAAAITPAVQDVLTDIAGWLHLPLTHPGAWAAVILAGVGAWLHSHLKGTTP